MKEMPKEELLAEVYEKAFYYEAHHHDCAQCVLLTLQEAFDIPGEDAFKAATGFAGGMGRTGQVCGCISGAIFAFGLLWGREKVLFMHPDEKERLSGLEALENRIGPIIKKLQARFREEYDGITCDEIQTKLFGKPYASGTPEDREEMDRLGGHSEVCPKVVGKAAQWAAEIILDENEREQGQ